EIRNLRTYFRLDEGLLKAVDGVSLSVGRRKTLGVIGESGCGKSVTAQSVMQIVPAPGRIVDGAILLHREDGTVTDLAKLSSHGSEIRAIRGKEISMIFQEPMTSLSPVHTIGNQIMESCLLHITRDRREAKERSIEMLRKVGIPNPGQRFDAYPHQLSGGLRQRAMIAMALSCNPYLLIADEPTTALDVTVQAQILDLMRGLQESLGMAMLYITHDLGVISELADEVAVMYLGQEVEYARVRDIFHQPLHPYTSMLLRSIPKVGLKARTRLEAIAGNVPIPMNLPRECPFLSRCPKAMPGICDRDVPPLTEQAPGHFVRCYLYGAKE
ncbi:MAG TPA: ABC transporter ATP-binding protein, partial [Spirochaetia bacterium]|nr:ABC transporter ATP-binding protein [Spirochaetia bacterium]